MRRVCINEELGHDAGFGYDLSVKIDGRHKSTLITFSGTRVLKIALHTYRIDIKIPRVTGFGEIDDHFFVGETKLFQDNVRAMGPRATMIRV